MDLTALILMLINSLDGMTETEQADFSKNIGSTLGRAAKSSSTPVDDVLLKNVAIPNIRIALDAAEAELNAPANPAPGA